MEVEPVENQLLAIYNTVYYYDQWIDEFDEADTEVGTFYRRDGGESSCEYMYSHTLGRHWYGDDYKMLTLNTKGSSYMAFVLPDEGVDLYEWLSLPENIEVMNAVNDETLTEAIIIRWPSGRPFVIRKRGNTS